MAKNFTILILLALVVWLGLTVVRLENVAYAARLGMCDHVATYDLPKKADCYRQVHTRTNGWWHLAYALGLL